MVMEAKRAAPRRGVVLSLRSQEDLGLVGAVVDTCVTHGVRHKTFLREALRQAVADPRVMEAAKRADVEAVTRRREAYRNRMRWYRGRTLI